MEFEASVLGEKYKFSFLNKTSVLVSGRKGEYILYKNKTWRCADELSKQMVYEFGRIIEEHLRMIHQ